MKNSAKKWNIQTETINILDIIISTNKRISETSNQWKDYLEHDHTSQNG